VYMGEVECEEGVNSRESWRERGVWAQMESEPAKGKTEPR
jgi:hypothetical protein